jgi:hypothetical protein
MAMNIGAYQADGMDIGAYQRSAAVAAAGNPWYYYAQMVLLMSVINEFQTLNEVI